MLAYTGISDDSSSRALTERSASVGPVCTAAAQSATTSARNAYFRSAERDDHSARCALPRGKHPGHPARRGVRHHNPPRDECALVPKLAGAAWAIFEAVAAAFRPSAARSQYAFDICDLSRV
jgi:hypothetical protein